MLNSGAGRWKKIGQRHNELCLCAAFLGLLTAVNEVTVSGGICWH